MAFSRLLTVNVTVGSGGTISTTTTSNFDYNGITYTLQTAAPVGYFLDGSPFIVSDGVNKITATTEPSVSLNGGIAYGMMKNPYWNYVGGDPEAEQGLDEFFADHAAFGRAFEVPYVAALNIDPNVSDDASWTAGEVCTFIKAIRSPNKTGPNAQHQTCTRYDRITVLDEAPPLRSIRPKFMPGASAVSKIIRQCPTAASFTRRNHTMPVSFGAIADVIADVEDDLGFFSHNSVLHRFYRLTQESGTATTGYSASLVPEHSKFIYAMNSTAPDATQLEQMLITTMKHGIDVEAMLDYKGSVDANAGQGGCRWEWMMAMACVLEDATISDKIRGLAQPDNSRTFWIDQSNVGQSVGNQYTSGGIVSGATCQTYFQEMVDMPWSEPDEWTSGYGRYTNTGGKIIAWENLAIASFAQAPAGYADGRALILNGGAENDPSNQWAAGLAFASRQRTWVPAVTWSHTLGQNYFDAWDTLVTSGGISQWEGRPNQPPHARESTFDPPAFFSSPSSGVARLDIAPGGSPVEYDNHGASLTRDMRISLDGYQWIEDADITLTGNTYDWTGLIPGAEYWCGWRMVNEHGVGVWSNNQPLSGSWANPDENTVTITGGGSALAPSWTGGVTPKIVRRLYPNWDYDKVCDENPAALSVGDEVFCGVGHVGNAAYPAPTYTYQWKRNGSNVTGAASKSYTVQAGDVGTTLTCEIAASNASGADVITTAGVTVS